MRILTRVFAIVAAALFCGGGSLDCAVIAGGSLDGGVLDSGALDSGGVSGCGEPPSGALIWFDGRDPAGTGTPPADGAAVATWVDKGSIGVDLVNASSTTQPRYVAAGYLDLQTSAGGTGSNKSMAATPVAGHIDAYKHVASEEHYCATVFFADPSTTHASVLFGLWAINDYSTSPGAYYLIDNRQSLGRDEKWFAGTAGDGGAAASLFTANAAVDVDAWEHVFVTGNTASWSLQTGETTSTDSTVTARTYTVTPSNSFTIGQVGGIGTTSVGYLAQIICYDTPSAATKSAVETWATCLEGSF